MSAAVLGKKKTATSTKEAEPKPKKTAAKAVPAKKTQQFAREITLKPRVSEKAYGLSELTNTYVFDVPTTANNLSVAGAVEAQYAVSVKSVRITNIPGKVKKAYRRRGRSVNSVQRSNVRKAYVTLADGDKLPIFAAAEDTKPPVKENK